MMSKFVNVKRLKLDDVLQQQDELPLYRNGMFTGLPCHVWARIVLHYMNNVRDIERLSATCRYFRTYCGLNEVWFYIMKRRVKLTDEEFFDIKQRYRYVLPKHLFLIHLTISKAQDGHTFFYLKPKGISIREANANHYIWTISKSTVIEWSDIDLTCPESVDSEHVVFKRILSCIALHAPWVEIKSGKIKIYTRENSQTTKRELSSYTSVTFMNTRHARTKLIVLLIDVLLTAGYEFVCHEDYADLHGYLRRYVSPIL